jgi:2C-methyl-D-erythritol 2,4-cyclodiphosphate synthase
VRPPEAVTLEDRTDVAIHAAADALLAVCALQTGYDPAKARARAVRAVASVFEQAKREHEG